MNPLQPIVPPGHPDPKKALDQSGKALLAIKRMQKMAVDNTTKYWERYLEDCKIHKIEPLSDAPPAAAPVPTQVQVDCCGRLEHLDEAHCSPHVAALDLLGSVKELMEYIEQLAKNAGITQSIDHIPMIERAKKAKEKAEAP